MVTLAGLGAGLALVLVGCGASASDRPSPTSTTQAAPADVPLVDARWQQMPQAPLSPRSPTSTVWTGDRLLLLGGSSVDAEQEPCPPAASCAGPPSTAYDDGAAWDPAERTWTHLGAVGRPLSRSATLRWTGTQAIGVGGVGTPDLAAGTITWAPLPSGEALVYDEPTWTGSLLVASGWDYGGTLTVAPDGRLLLRQDHLYVRSARSAHGSGWRRLPDLPSTVQTRGRAVAWAGGSIVVWGGSSSGISGEHTVNTADGWTITPPDGS